jgi:hypothetical protein
MEKSKKCEEDQIRGEYTCSEAGASGSEEGGRRLKKACKEEGRIRRNTGKGPGGVSVGKRKGQPGSHVILESAGACKAWNMYKRRIPRFFDVV